MQLEMNKSSNQWLCSDRELLLRSKLEAGWSVKSTNFRTIATNCKEEIKEPNTINQITDSEQEMIMEVLRRSQRIDQMEQRRINKLLERLKTMKRNAKGDGQQCCALCSDTKNVMNEMFSFFIKPSKICNDCKKYVCAKCSIINYSTNKKKIVLCKLCNETRENNIQKSDTNDKEADTLHRRCSSLCSEQTYYEIINSNNHFESSNKDKSNFLIPPLYPHAIGYDTSQNYAKNQTPEKDNQIVKNQNSEQNHSLELQMMHQSSNKLTNQALDNQILNQNSDETKDHNSTQTIGQCLGQTFCHSLEKNITKSLKHTQQQPDLFKSKEEEKLKELERDEKNSLIDNQCLFMVPLPQKTKQQQQNFKSIETRRESNSSISSSLAVRFGTNNDGSNLNNQNSIRKMNNNITNEIANQTSHRLTSQLGNQINNNSNYRFNHSTNHHLAVHSNIDRSTNTSNNTKEAINDQIYRKIDQMKKINVNQSISEASYPATINHENFGFNRTNNMMNSQNQNLTVYNQTINHNQSSYQTNQHTNQVQCTQSYGNLISDPINDKIQSNFKNLSINQPRKMNDVSMNQRFYPIVNQTSHQYEHHSSIIHSIKSSTTNAMQPICSSFNNSYDLNNRMNHLLYPTNYMINQNIHPDRINSQNNNDNHLNVSSSFYYSQPTTPSSPMQTLNQHSSNQTMINNQSNISNRTNANYIAQNTLINQPTQSNQTNHQINQYNQFNQYNQLNQNIQSNQIIKSSNQFNHTTKTTNLIKSLCSPVRNNYFLNHYRSSNLIKSSSPNLTNNQISNPIVNQTNLIGSTNQLTAGSNFSGNKSSIDYRYIN